MRISENSLSDIINKKITETRDKAEKAECGK